MSKHDEGLFSKELRQAGVNSSNSTDPKNVTMMNSISHIVEDAIKNDFIQYRIPLEVHEKTLTNYRDLNGKSLTITEVLDHISKKTETGYQILCQRVLEAFEAEKSF